MQTFSQGRLHLTTADPEVDPEIDFHLLSDERDLVRLRDGVRRLFDLARHPVMAAIIEAVHVGMSGQKPNLTDEVQLDQWLMAECGEFWHACGIAVWVPQVIHSQLLIQNVALLASKGCEWWMHPSCLKFLGRIPI